MFKFGRNWANLGEFGAFWGVLGRSFGVDASYLGAVPKIVPFGVGGGWNFGANRCDFGALSSKIEVFHNLGGGRGRNFGAFWGILRSFPFEGEIPTFGVSRGDFGWSELGQKGSHFGVRDPIWGQLNFGGNRFNLGGKVAFWGVFFQIGHFWGFFRGGFGSNRPNLGFFGGVFWGIFPQIDPF